jgi:arginase
MEDGPAAVAAALGVAGARIVDLDLDAPPADSLAAGLPALRAAVAGAGEAPLVLLGECTLTPAVTAGLRDSHPDLVLVWVDAHGDLNTPATTPSGFLGGMPFAVLLGWCHDRLRAAAGLEPPLPEARAALVGARDLDPGERDAIAASALVVADDVAAALAGLPVDAPVHLHLDGDVLDPTDAPGVDFPAPGGWSGARLDAELAALAATGRVVGVSVCCGNPHRDPDGRSARAYARALQPLLTT